MTSSPYSYYMRQLKTSLMLNQTAAFSIASDVLQLRHTYFLRAETHAFLHFDDERQIEQVARRLVLVLEHFHLAAKIHAKHLPRRDITHTLFVLNSYVNLCSCGTSLLLSRY